MLRREIPDESRQIASQVLLYPQRQSKHVATAENSADHEQTDDILCNRHFAVL